MAEHNQSRRDLHVNTCQSLYHNHIFVFIFLRAVNIASILTYNTGVILSMYPAPPSVNNTFKQISDAVKGERSPFKKTTNYNKTSSEFKARAPVTALHSLSRETIVIFQD